MHATKSFVILAIVFIWQLSIWVAFWPALKRTAQELGNDWRHRKEIYRKPKTYFVHYDL